MTFTLDELEAICGKATEAPWEYFIFKYNPDEYGVHVPAEAKPREDGDGIHSVAICQGMTGSNKINNSFFIAAARTAVPELIARVRELEDVVRRRSEHCDDKYCRQVLTETLEKKP